MGVGGHSTGGKTPSRTPNREHPRGTSIVVEGRSHAPQCMGLGAARGDNSVIVIQAHALRCVGGPGHSTVGKTRGRAHRITKTREEHRSCFLVARHSQAPQCLGLGCDGGNCGGVRGNIRDVYQFMRFKKKRNFNTRNRQTWGCGKIHLNYK